MAHGSLFHNCFKIYSYCKTLSKSHKFRYCPFILPPSRRSRCRRTGRPACRGARRRIPALVSSWGSCKMQLHVSCSKNVPPVLNFQYFTWLLLCISPLPGNVWCGSLLHTQADNCVLPATCATGYGLINFGGFFLSFIHFHSQKLHTPIDNYALPVSFATVPVELGTTWFFLFYLLFL